MASLLLFHLSDDFCQQLCTDVERRADWQLAQDSQDFLTSSPASTNRSEQDADGAVAPVAQRLGSQSGCTIVRQEDSLRMEAHQ